MSKSVLINRMGRLCLSLHRRLLSEMTGADLEESAVVFAPHQDDETLGCGGTIIKKIQAGARVDLVFLTDGSRSHAHLIPRDRMKAMREQEALAAARMLGLDESRITFLTYENGRLGANEEEAMTRVKDLLKQLLPRQVYVPCCQENIPDHVAAHRIVLGALGGVSVVPMIYEYPVWFWLHWPWVSMPWKHPRKSLEMMRDTLAAGFGLKLMTRFRSSVYIGDVLELKRRALASHRSQTVCMMPGMHWPVLSDVANGEFLDCFFQNYEVFYRHRMRNPREDTGWPMAGTLFA